MIERRGKICLSAVGASVAIHLALLGGFVSVHLHTPKDSGPTIGAVAVHSVQRRIEQPLITPKPEVKAEEPPIIEEKPTEEPAAVIPAAMEHVMNQPAVTVQETPVVEEAPIASGAEFFGQETAASTVCFVVDCSGSMYGRKELISRQLKECIASLKDTQSFYLIFFMDGETLLESGDGKVVAASGFAKARAFEMIGKLHLEGQTNARQALERAMKIRDTIGRSVQLIYFLTDGFDLQISSSQAFYAELSRMRRKYAPSVVINTIGLWASPEDQALLQGVAEATGGQFIHVD